ncbi:MAG: ATP-binding cassette domain-containing protein [Pseudomonadota bacterium]|nr:ATP-binding cassette domain-containing protein [Pseudomonadota bacterium]
MIDLDALTKSFPGSPRPAVDRLTLTIPAGEVCVLIGPSGCGKTTTMRMINRMIEPDAGAIMVEGRNILHVDPVELRRSIGYVIQQVGLFPHWSIADNIATVPRLLGWEPTRTDARVDELLSLVGMEPAQYRQRFPRELSGGQKQRVGVARALAADPPVMLMDEPFGALDPITRTRLQAEFLRILRGLKKTIVFVTHDIDEAIKMGDRIAIMKDGELVQYDTPEAILARPVDAFVEEFVGSDRVLKRLALIPAADVMSAGAGGGDVQPRIAVDASARDALAAMLAAGADSVTLVDENGAACGTITLAAMRARLTAPDGGSTGQLQSLPIH